jgi:hypothetical protein
MKLTAMVLASAFALSSPCAFADTVRHVRTHTIYRDAVPSVVLYPNGNVSGDVWGHWGAYYGPMIPSGAGGR